MTKKTTSYVLDVYVLAATNQYTNYESFAEIKKMFRQGDCDVVTIDKKRLAVVKDKTKDGRINKLLVYTKVRE